MPDRLRQHIIADIRDLTRALYPEARIPETEMPSAPKFTPGPWGLHPSGVVKHLSPDHIKVIAVICNHPSHEADAALIASAPELYSALSAVLGWMDDNPTGVGMLAACNHAKQVLAKARGETL